MPRGGLAEGYNLPDLGEESHTIMSPAEQKRLGEEFYRMARLQMKLVQDPVLNDYIKTLGGRLVQAAGIDPASFTFFLIEDNSINAFAVPGGVIGVHTGLLLTAQNEAEVASVLGHEIVHVTQQHIPRMYSQMQKDRLVNLATLLAGLLAGGQATEAAIAVTAASSAQNQLSYTRAFEREADRLGIGILANAGYDTNAMPDFFGRMQQATRLYESTAPEFLRTHPITTDRIAEAKARAAELRPETQQDDDLFWHVRARLRTSGMPARDAVTYFSDKLPDAQGESRQAARYGLALALLANEQFDRAASEIEALRSADPGYTLYALLQADLEIKRGNPAEGLALYRSIYQDHGESYAVSHYYAEALLRNGQAAEARQVLRRATRRFPAESSFYKMLAQAEDAYGDPVESHRAMAEYHYLYGDLKAAVQQLQIAAKAADKDNFYLQSSIAARIKEIREEMMLQAKQR